MRWNGRLYEWWAARREHRAPGALFHCGLMLRLDGITYAVEMGPVWNVSDADRGVLVEGPVGSRWLGRFRAFRYEMRCWPGGRIPDVAEAVDSPVRTTVDATRVAARARRAPETPALTWGRDELGTGEMWNSNSAVAWALARTGQDMSAIRPPSGAVHRAGPPVWCLPIATHGTKPDRRQRSRVTQREQADVTARRSRPAPPTRLEKHEHP